MTAPIDLVEVDDLGIGPFGPAPGRLVDLAGKTVTGPDARVCEKAIAELPNDSSAISGASVAPLRGRRHGAVRTRTFAALAFASCAFVGCPISETIHDLSNDWRTARGCHRANLVGDVVSMSRGLTVDDAS